MNHPLITLTLLIPTLMGSQALAQPPADTDFLNCRKVTNETARLHCYDALADSLSDRTATRQAELEQAVTAAKESAARNFGRSASTESEPAVIAPSVTPEARAIIEAAKEPDEITATVTQVKDGATGRTFVYLDNGQIWQETSASQFRSKLKAGETATISKGGLGWFRMRFKDTYGVMAVKRVK